MDKLNIILIMSAIMAVTVMGILNNSFKNGTFTCDKYILNTYLYLILAIIFVALFVQTMTSYNVTILSDLIGKYRFAYIFILFIGLIISILGISLVDPKNIYKKHLFWLLFVTLSAMLFQPIHMMYVKAGLQSAIINALVITFILVSVLTAIAFLKPDFIKPSWGPILFFALLGAILVEIVALLTGSYNNRLMNYIVIFIFIGYLLYDTKFMRVRAKKCLEDCEYYSFNRFDHGAKCVKPDYIRESINIFLDIYNLFLRILGNRTN